MADPMIITETAADGSTVEFQVIEASDDSTLIEDVIEALSGGADDSTVWVDDDGNIVDNFEATAPTADHPAGAMTVDEAYDQINNNHGGGIGMSVDEAYASLETGNASVTVEEAYADLAHSTAQTMAAAQNIPGFAEQMQNDPAVANLFNLPQSTDGHLPGVMTVDEAYDQINNNHGGVGMSVDEAYASLGHNYSHAHDNDGDFSTE